jgi:hypothetical protein
MIFGDPIRDGFAPSGGAKVDEHYRITREMMKNRGVSFEYAHDCVRRLRPELLNRQAALPDTLETALLMQQEIYGRTGVEAWEAVRKERPELLMGKPAAAIPPTLQNRRATLRNRAFQLAGDWVELVRIGEWPHENGIQVIDEEALFRMTMRFAADAAKPNFPGVLVDYDHDSHDLDKPSKAAGWIQELRKDAGRLEGRIDWTVSGEEALTSGNYRLLSPTFTEAEDLGNGRLRPSRLHSAALTNVPNLKGLAPLSR